MISAIAAACAISRTGAIPLTRFTVVNDHGIMWIRRPDGRRVWSLGVCCVGPGDTEKSFDPKNPGYGAFRFYPDDAAWAKDTVTRLTEWGFNTVGAWSADAELQKASPADVIFTPILHIGSSAGAPWRDMWDPKVVRLMDDVARVQILAHHQDPRVLGYFSDNEQGWWYGAMWEWAFKAGPTSRNHVVDLLARFYHSSWRQLQRDFDPDKADGFSTLRKSGRLYLRPGSHGIHAIQAWMGVVSERYYSLCRSIIKKYDPGALYLGDRYISNFYPEIARSAGRACDVVSTNLNADSNQGDFAPFYLPALEALTGRPLMITEYYACAAENRSGDRNDSSGFPVVATQVERAEVFAKQTSYFAQNPNVVGAHWFQYYDEPGRGRGDGENYDMGLVDVDNFPYRELTQSAHDLDLADLHRHGRPPTPTAGALPELDRARMKDVGYWLSAGRRIQPQTLPLRGDLYAGHVGDDLYLAIYWNEDRFAENLYRGGKVPLVDLPELRVDNGRSSFRCQPGAGSSERDVSRDYLRGVRNLTVMHIPHGLHSKWQVRFATARRAYMDRWLVPGDSP